MSSARVLVFVALSGCLGLAVGAVITSFIYAESHAVAVCPPVGSPANPAASGPPSESGRRALDTLNSSPWPEPPARNAFGIR